MKPERRMNNHRNRRIVRVLTIGALIAGLGACNRGGADWRQARPSDQAAAADAAYVRPPQILEAKAGEGGAVILSGRSEPLATIRVSSPGGGAEGRPARADGTWSVPTPPSHDVREFGLSEVIVDHTGQVANDRVVQSEGYVAVIPGERPTAVLLRAGTGSIVLGWSDGGLHLRAVDFDTGGGATVSGVAKPSGSVHLIVDGASAGEARADANGRFAITSSVLLKTGPHTLVVETPTAADQTGVAVSPPAPISGLPFHATQLAGSWRIDWATPGGGVQSTIILSQAERRS
jgi:hypothetical protein